MSGGASKTRDWTREKVLVTGGSGFLGRHVVARLEALGAAVVAPRKAEFDLTTERDASRCMSAHRPTMVIHGAAFYGGIWINQLHPGRIFYENLVMGAHVMEAARVAGVSKFVGIGTACSYPGYLEGDLAEDRLWDGPCHETVVNYGLTKKMMAVQGWAYRREYGFHAIHLILTNLYGPGDTFHIRRAHVASALVRKFVEADQRGDREVEVWGTGAPVREFLYVEDCAEAIVRAADVYDESAPINVGTGIGTSIRELAETIRDVVGAKVALRWNPDKPDGQARKVLDVSRMREALGWVPPTALHEGLRKTIAWYVANKEEADKRE